MAYAKASNSRPRLFLLIRRLRKESGMTQQQLSEKIGVSRSAVAMWESSGINPAEEVLPALAAALHCPLEQLTGPAQECGGELC